MRKKQRIFLYIVTLSLSAAWIVFSADSIRVPAKDISAPQVGFTAPDFTLRSIDGKTHTLSALKGNAILVNLWATWCPPCRAEMPAIEKMYQEYKDQGFIVLAINTTYQDEPSSISPFIKEYNLTFPILLDEKGFAGSAYQLHSMPSSYFIDRAGIISEVIIGGPMAEALLRTRIEKILR